jgi:hypothetical protein
VDLALSQLKTILEQKVNPEFRAYLLQEVPKGEALLAQAEPQSDLWKAVLGPLSKMYLVLNHQLGLTCKFLNLPTQQWKWDHSEPLETLAKVYPNIEATQWYQRHLRMMLIPPDQEHPWTKILT